ncbi:IclR family transcriptional regulator [Hoeflea sp. AS16]|uniref:IclR family transcriptional regulator n=1 Tax=Hoeflea sp. AS16 TaxID=3135779 RepID=UPI0031730AB2
MAKVETKRRGRTPDKEPVASAYRAPALEKGLDILELLASQAEGLTLSQIAQRLTRSVQEVYRVVLSLERRGYVRRDEDDSFQLSMKLFDLASNHLPVKRLLQSALPLLDRLATRVEQVVVISIIEGQETRVVMVADNPAPIGFRVRVGTQRPVFKTASGRVLLAFQPESYRQKLVRELAEASSENDKQANRYIAAVEEIRKRGYEFVSGETLGGITDISYPVLDANGVAMAALTMPYLVWVENNVQLKDAAQQLYECAASLSEEIGGHLPQPDLSGLKS